MSNKPINFDGEFLRSPEELAEEAITYEDSGGTEGFVADPGDRVAAELLDPASLAREIRIYRKSGHGMGEIPTDPS